MSLMVETDPDKFTRFIDAQDDMLQALAAVEQLEAEQLDLAGVMVSGMPLPRRVHAFTNLSAHLIQLLADETGQSLEQVSERIRGALLAHAVNRP